MSEVVLRNMLRSSLSKIESVIGMLETLKSICNEISQISLTYGSEGITRRANRCKGIIETANSMLSTSLVNLERAIAKIETPQRANDLRRLDDYV